MDKSLDRKLAALRGDPHGCGEFILADAKDADMALGVAAPGPLPDGRYKSLAAYREQIRAVVEQGLVDIMLLSASNVEQLAIHEGLFERSAVTPAARANDTSDIWLPRGGAYSQCASRPFRSASIDHIKYGERAADDTQPVTGADLGLYSLTFVNDRDRDHETLTAFAQFREEAERKQFRYFLEVFNPNVKGAVAGDQVGSFLNDHIVRTLAGVTRSQRPLFLKIPYNGPRVLEELVAYDSQLIVGILGGGAGTTLDAFQLIHDVRKHGARVALFGRKINYSEAPLAFIAYLRRIVQDEIAPRDAVRAYHNDLDRSGITPLRDLDRDLVMTDPSLHYG
jgi:hypothetical protein